MNLKSILGGKTQEEIDEIIRDNNSALHVHMKNSNAQASSWITVNDLINAIEQRLLESPNENYRI
jgi:flagellar hook-associated protein FlgK